MTGDYHGTKYYFNKQVEANRMTDMYIAYVYVHVWCT
jgi:hypothetical protein